MRDYQQFIQRHVLILHFLINRSAHYLLEHRILDYSISTRSYNMYMLFKASQPRGRASGSCAYERHEIQGVILKCTRHECSVVNLRTHLLHIHSRHQFSSPEKKWLPLRDSNTRSSVYQTEHITTLPRGRPEGRVRIPVSALETKPKLGTY